MRECSLCCDGPLCGDASKHLYISAEQQPCPTLFQEGREKNAVKFHKHCQESSRDKCMLAALPNHPRGSPRSRMSLFFAPLDRGKWGSLNWCGFIVSPAVWSNEHITHPPHPEICGTVHTSVFTPYEILFGTAALDDHLSIAAAFRSGCFLKHKPLVFITTVALSYTNCLLIQLQESSWTIQKWNAVTSKKGKTGCVVPHLARRGS